MESSLSQSLWPVRLPEERERRVGELEWTLKAEEGARARQGGFSSTNPVVYVPSSVLV
jgi:hypothetical protein